MLAILVCAASLLGDFSDELKTKFNTDRKEEIAKIRKDIATKNKSLDDFLNGRASLGGYSHEQSVAITKNELRILNDRLKSLINNNPPFTPRIDLRTEGSVGHLKGSEWRVVNKISENFIILETSRGGAKIGYKSKEKIKISEGAIIKLEKLYKVTGSHEVQSSKPYTINVIEPADITKEELEEWANTTRLSK